MTDPRSEISLQLTQLVIRFSRPFPVALESDGWCEVTWVKWGRIFVQMNEAFFSGVLPPDASIARAMDFDGIVKGELLEQAAYLSNLMRQFRERT